MNTPPQIPGGASGMPPQGGQGGQDDQEAPGEIPVPLAALAQPDDQEAMQQPEVGDTITMQVDATVCRIEGDCAYVYPTAVNGNPLPGQQKTPTPDDTDDQEGSELQAQAQQMSQ